MNMRRGKRNIFVFLVTGIFIFLILNVSILRADEKSTEPVSKDSVNAYLDNAGKALDSNDQDKAIAELMKAIKEQQAIIENLQKSQQSQPQYSTSTNYSGEYTDNPNLLEQMRQALPFVGGQYGDVEEQWRKAYKIQHKAIFDVSRRDAPPIFEEAVKEYRILVQYYPNTKRAAQSQRQIAWIYQTQLKNENQARIEWKKLLDLYPKSSYASEARKYLSDMGEKISS